MTVINNFQRQLCYYINIIIFRVGLFPQRLWSSYSKQQGGLECAQQSSAGCAAADGDALSGHQIVDLLVTGRSLCCVCVNGPAHPQLSVVSVQWAESQSPESNGEKNRALVLVLIRASQSRHPNPEERKGGREMEFPTRFFKRPATGPLGLRGPQSSDTLQLFSPFFFCQPL